MVPVTPTPTTTPAPAIGPIVRATRYGSLHGRTLLIMVTDCPRVASFGTDVVWGRRVTVYPNGDTATRGHEHLYRVIDHRPPTTDHE